MSETVVEVTLQPIRDDIFVALAHPTCGAQTTFRGVVREQNDGRRVRAVTYEAYLPLAKSTFERICGEARERWGAELRLVLVHALGVLPVGAASVAIGAASPHRDEAFQACRYLIEEVKHRAPIWKKEHYIDGESGWIQGCCLRR